MIHLTWSWWSFCSLNAGLNWWHFSPRKPPRLEEIWYPSRDETQGVPLRTAPTWLSTTPSTQPHIKRWILCHFPPLLKVTQHQFCSPVGWSGHSPPTPTFTEERQGHIVKEPWEGNIVGTIRECSLPNIPPTGPRGKLIVGWVISKDKGHEQKKWHFAQLVVLQSSLFL